MFNCTKLIAIFQSSLYVLTMYMCLVAFISCKKYNAPIAEYNKLYGGPRDDFGYSIAPANDGGFIIAGTTASNTGDITGNHGNTDIWVIKIDVNGTRLWQKTFGGSQNDSASAIISTSDGGFAIAGSTSSTDGDIISNHGNQDFWVMKIDTNGKLIWQKTYGGSGQEKATSIAENIDGELLIAGFTKSPRNEAKSDGDVEWAPDPSNLRLQLGSFAWLIKISTTGNLIWSRVFGIGNYSSNFYWNAVTVSLNDQIIVAGSTNEDPGDISNTGDMQAIRWSEQGYPLTGYNRSVILGTSKDFANAVATSSDSGYVMAGSTNSKDGYFSSRDSTKKNVNFDFCLYKQDYNGAAVWIRTYGGSGVDIANAIIRTSDGGFLVAGQTNSNDSKDGDVVISRGGIDAWVIKVDSKGNKLWQQRIGGSGTDIAYGLIEIPRRGYVVVGSTNSNDGDFSSNHGGYDIFTVTIKTDF